MSTLSNKLHGIAPTLIYDTTLTEALQTDQLTGNTGRVYSITITNGASADIFFAIYDSADPTAGSNQTCMFRLDNGVDHTITSKTGIPINTALAYACSTNANGSGTPSSCKAYISGS
jgi:hypothetical protein